jgi:hypothetical protein
MTPEQRRQFVLDHRTAIFGYNRAKDGPAMSIVYYCLQQNEILVSTMAERAKARAVARSPKVSLCVLDEQWPPSYLQVYCDAALETDFESVVDVMMLIAGVMAGTPMSQDIRPMVAEATPIRHLIHATAPRSQRSGHRPRPGSRHQRFDPMVRRLTRSG